VRWSLWKTSQVSFIIAAFSLMAACTVRSFTPKGHLTPETTTLLPPLPTLDAAQVQKGQEIYQTNCAACHGANAEGAPNWATPGSDGLFPAPPHDDRGHTWHHSDRVLYQTISGGMADPLRPGSPLRMPAWKEKLSDAEIRAVVEYFKSLWSEEHRRWQWEQTLNDFAPTPTPP
jgi:mono/diheme cytochrome c family protein